MGADRMLDRLRRIVRVVTGSFLWLIILIPILGVSGYSFFTIARYFGVPWYVAIAVSTCFDGVALFAARKSVDYAQEGLSGSFPRSVVRVFAAIGAYLQTFHSRIGHELPGAWVIWASLPIGAVIVYEIHVRWEKRKALARSGSIYPAPLPQFGLMSWVLFPWSTLMELRTIVMARRKALSRAAATLTASMEREAGRVRPVRDKTFAEPLPEPVPEEAADGSQMAQERISADVRQERTEATVSRLSDAAKKRRHKLNDGGRTFHSGSKSAHSPVKHIRAWAKQQPEWAGKIGDHARLPQAVKDAYYAAHPEETAIDPVVPSEEESG
jgi:hypothetical protein